jgi:hypothetical protein
VSRRQGRFEGSHRQVRGRVLRALADGPLPESALVEGSEAARGSEVAAALASLAEDGLLELVGERWCLRG